MAKCVWRNWRSNFASSVHEQMHFLLILRMICIWIKYLNVGARRSAVKRNLSFSGNPACSIIWSFNFHDSFLPFLSSQVFWLILRLKYKNLVLDFIYQSCFIIKPTDCIRNEIKNCVVCKPWFTVVIIWDRGWKPSTRTISFLSSLLCCNDERWWIWNCGKCDIRICLLTFLLSLTLTRLCYQMLSCTAPSITVKANFLLNVMLANFM